MGSDSAWSHRLFRCFVVIIALIGVTIYGVFVPRVFVGDVQRTLEAALPIGTSKETVRDWLASQPRIVFSDITTVDGDFVAFHAVVRHSGTWLVDADEVCITLNIENDKLVNVRVVRMELSL